MSLINSLLALVGRVMRSPPALPGESSPLSTETGRRPTPENQTRYLYRVMWVDSDLRRAILDIRDMDARDGRVKRIHGRMARTAVKGGLRLCWSGDMDADIDRRWREFCRRLHLHRQEKLESDARGLIMEGNLPMQWVLDAGAGRVAEAVRMPAETILPNIDVAGRFKDPARAYTQYDINSGVTLAEFPLWQLSMVRLSPASYDDQGALGRPYLDAVRETWLKLRMTDEDLVIRRRQRAPLRLAHTLEGATSEELKKYREETEAEAGSITTDFYLNRKGGVEAIQGDAKLSEIDDVLYLLDTFFAGAPGPKALFGYPGDTARDVLEDLKRDYFQEIDALQDTLSFVYLLGFRLDLLLSAINPDAYQFDVVFAERQTETPTQATDRALKLQSLGVPESLCWEVAGLDPAQVAARREEEGQRRNPYPDDSPGAIARGRRVTVVEGNAPKGDSQTTITNSRRGAA